MPFKFNPFTGTLDEVNLSTGAQGPAGPSGATGPSGTPGVVSGAAPITYNSGTQTVGITAATTTVAGSMSANDKTKLDGIASGATANSSDAFLLSRTNHTGTQSGATVTGLYTAAGLTMNTARILGRTTASSGAAEEITIGSNLTLSAGVLSATASGSGGGTVTSVGLSLPALFSISNSPVTTTGTLTATLATQNANVVLAGPTTGAAATPTFRALVANDLPATTVTAGSYTYTSITVDAAGRITSASSGTNPLDRANHTGTQPGSTVTGLYTAAGLTMNTARILGRTTASSGATEEISIGSGLVLSGGTLVATATGSGGSGTPGGSTTQVQFNDAGVFAGDADLTWNKTTNVLAISGDVNLSDGGTYTTTLQTITPTAARTISLPDATGTVALVSGSSGQLIYNNAGVYAGGPLFNVTAGTLGYDTGGTVTQATNKSTGVTLNGASGRITMNSAQLNADTTVSFILTNSSITANDLLILNHVSGGTNIGSYSLNAQAAAGSATINVHNLLPLTNLSEAIVIGFAVIKA